MAKILVADDDSQNAANVADWLKYDHHSVETVYDGNAALDMLSVYSYDLLILDWDMPGMKGVDLCVKLRSAGNLIPILMLTGKGTIREKEIGLDSGADDYLTKPFHMKELSARVRSLLRRINAAAATSNELRIGDLTLDTTAYRVTRNGVDLHLPPTEFSLLEFLMRHPGEVFSVEALLNRVRSSNSEATAEAIRICLRRLRQRISEPESAGETKPMIANVHGVGYKLEN